MNESANARPLRKHLLSPGALARAAQHPGIAGPSRPPGHGNGVRVHAIYFAAVSLAGLLLVLAAAALATAR